MCIAVSDEYLAAERLFGIKKDDPPLQCLPTVLTRSHRMLAFNNVMQHRVGPCSLRDRSRPGHRKILALFLVDPHVPILSTSHVPPQQRDWWAERVRQEGRFRDLPEELFQQVMGEVEDFPLSWERACEVREALTVEREGLKESLERRWCEVSRLDVVEET